MNTYLIVKTLHILSATLMCWHRLWHGVLPLLGQPQRLRAGAGGGVEMGHQGRLVVHHARRDFPTAVGLVDDVAGQLILRHKMDSLDHRPVYLERHLLAARGLAANPSGENGAGRTRSGRKQPAAKILALCADLGTVGLSCLLRHSRHLLPDGAQTCLRPSENRL